MLYCSYQRIRQDDLRHGSIAYGMTRQERSGCLQRGSEKRLSVELSLHLTTYQW